MEEVHMDCGSIMTRGFAFLEDPVVAGTEESSVLCRYSSVHCVLPEAWREHISGNRAQGTARTEGESLAVREGTSSQHVAPEEEDHPMVEEG